MRKMSNDLISRKAAYEAFSDYINRSVVGEITPQTELSIGEIASVIKSIPVAFDKEKVIDELYRYTAEECELHECGIRSEYCNVCMAKKAIEIVEKGGIE